ncbi:MAG: hypothetical protein KGI91_16580 [Burkholderiales bacterium]|nr:hypothetical protein [Burkholderiales bacterium]MDE2078663.1 hypothetical protein [Burkholderiales bacterium]MDE2434024.1 hypothetical protein [Burkholderiales bacterium]
MTTTEDQCHHLSPIAKAALGILSVDGLKVSTFGMDLLVQLSQGLITRDQARELLRAQGLRTAAQERSGNCRGDSLA